MKLRIQGNSIRFRVTQNEVAMLAATGKLESWIQFTPSAADKLGYAIEVSSQCSDVHASCADNQILVSIPANLASTWVSTNQIGIERDQLAADGSVLRIVVEKDFRCLQARPGEDESDNYPNPAAGTQA
jgi:hypothetical protein